ncbi:MAG: TMEM165/GDT1 family protein, partial [Candidatus Nanopelagicales bacterium]
ATLVLSTRYRPLAVWLGVALAFAVQSAVAVGAGQILTLLPRAPVLMATACLFAAGSIVIFRSAVVDPADAQRSAAEELADGPAVAGGWRPVWISFGVLFAAEWGDLSQLTTAALSARFDAPFTVFLGSWLALLLVAGLAVLAGRALAERLSFAVIRRISGSLLAVLAIVTAVEAVRVSGS